MFKNLFNSLAKHRTIVKNFGYLSILQVINLLIPLATYPYLIRVLGKDSYGLVIYAQAIIGYLLILVKFGFDVSAMNLISIHRDNKNKLSEIVSSTLVLKSILFLCSIILLYIFLCYVPVGQKNQLLFILCMWICLYDILFPIWYFQGIEKMQYITVITLISRLIFLIFIFILIKAPDDYLFVPIINGGGALLSGITALYIVFVKHRIKFILPGLNDINKLFKESLTIFLSSSSIKIYLNANKVVLGTFFGVVQVAYYDLGEKLLNVAKIPLGLITQAIFPKISKERNIKFLNRLMKYTLIGTIIIYLIIYISAPLIVELVGGLDMVRSIPVVRILCLNIILVGLSQYMGSIRLVPFGYSKELLKATFSSLLFYCFLVFILYITEYLSLNNIAWSSVLVDLWIVIIYTIICKRYKLF